MNHPAILHRILTARSEFIQKFDTPPERLTLGPQEQREFLDYLKETDDVKFGTDKAFLLQQILKGSVYGIRFMEMEVLPSTVRKTLYVS